MVKNKEEREPMAIMVTTLLLWSPVIYIHVTTAGPG